MKKNDEVDMEKHGWLLNTPATDGNFKAALERANMATIRFALQNVRGATKVKALETQLKKLERQGIDPDSEAALEVVEVVQVREQSAQQEQHDREQRIAESYEVAGRIQAFTFMEKVLTVSTLVQLSKIKASKAYRDLPNIGSWDNYCEYLGFSRAKIDIDLQNLAAFGENFLQTCSQFSLGYRDLRKLRQLTADGTVTIDEAEIVINGERIPFTPEHRDDLQNALECVIEANAKIIAEKEATIKAKDKVLRSKGELIERQAKELGRLEDNAAFNGMTPLEETFIKRIENARTSFDGFMISLDPLNNPLPEDATPRMRAVYIEALAYFRRVFEAAHETAISYYDISSVENDGWTPPGAGE